MADEEKRGAAVYVGWATFKNALDQLAQGLPNRIDRTCFPGLAGGVQSQLLAALKFLSLIDDRGVPSPWLKGLATAADEAARKELLKKILEARYSEVLALDLAKATPAQVSETMARAYNVSGETKEKAIRFFLAAAGYAGVPLSALLLKVKPSAAVGGSSQRKRKAAAQRRAQDIPDDALSNEDQHAPGTARVVNLKSGGTLTISVSLDVLRLSATDRNFVFGLIDKLEEYEKAAE